MVVDVLADGSRMTAETKLRICGRKLGSTSTYDEINGEVAKYTEPGGP